MVQILGYTEDKIIAAKASKKITASDYHKLLPLIVNRLKQHAHIRLYLEVTDLEGLALEELQDDLNFNAGLASAFDKVALVGKKLDEPWVHELLRNFSSAEVSWYGAEEKDEAIEWLRANRSRSETPQKWKKPGHRRLMLTGS